MNQGSSNHQMEIENSRYPISYPQQSSNHDELYMQHSLVFSDSLKDLKNLRKQLYSAAEYFELSYHKDDQKQLVLDSLKDYLTNALISTVDHLGSVAFKVNTFMDEKVDQVSGTNLRFSCLEQRLQTCQKYTDSTALSQQSLATKTPRYPKHCINQVGEVMNASDKRKSTYNTCTLYKVNSLNQRSNTAVQRRTMGRHSPLLRQDNSEESSSITGNFSFSAIASNKGGGKRAVSPHRRLIKHAESLIRRSISPNSLRSASPLSRSTSPVPSPSPRISKQRYPSEPRRSATLPVNAQRDRTTTEIEVYSKKSKQLFKALLSMRK